MSLFRRRKLKQESAVCYAIMGILAAICVLPVLLTFSASVTSESYIQKNGYSLIPREFTLDTYEFLFKSKLNVLLRAFWMSFKVVILGTVTSVTITTCFAYAVTQKKKMFRFARPLSFIAWFTSVFGGGVLPWYILCTRYYGLKDNIFALFIPSCFSVWNMFIIRGSFREIPGELIESAKLDGASEFRIFWNIAIPLARSGIVTVGLFSILGYWNDAYLPLWLIRSSDYYTAQKLLYDMMARMDILLSGANSQAVQHIVTPTNTAKMAVTVMTILPIVLFYPFGLKYFVKGINLGGVKG